MKPVSAKPLKDQTLPIVKPASWLLFAFIAIVGFSFAFSMFRAAQGEIDPLSFGCITLGIGALGHFLISLFFCWKDGLSISFSRSMIGLAIFIGFCIASNDMNMFLMFSYGANISVAVPYFNMIVIALTVIFGMAVLREKITKTKIIGLLCAVCCVVLLNV